MEFFYHCVSEANLIPTAMMILIMLYWMLMIFGVVGMDMFDIDVDIDADLGLDVDADLGLDVDGEVSTAGGSTATGGDSFLKEVFDFFYLTDIPIVIVATTFMFAYWVSSLVTNGLFNEGQTFLVSLIWFIPNLIVGLAFMRISLIPLVRLFKKTGPEDRSRSDMYGRVGRVKSRQVTEQYGEIEVREDDGTEIVLNAYTAKNHRLVQGDAAKIISYNQDKGTFLVELTKWENNSDD